MILTRYTDFRACFGQGQAPDASGYEAWPVSKVLYPPGEPWMDLVVPGGPSCAKVISVNGQADDAAPGVDEFDWYLSCRTDEPDRWLVSLGAFDGATGTRSGTVWLFPTPLAERYGATPEEPTPSLESAASIFRDVRIYVRRRSNGHIMHASLFAPVVP